MVKLELELCALDGVVRTQAPRWALVISTFAGLVAGKAALDLLFGAACAGNGYSTPCNSYRGCWKEKLYKGSWDFIHLCSLKRNKLGFRDHFPTVDEIEK